MRLLDQVGTPPEPGCWDDHNAAALTPAHEALDPATVQGWLDGILPAAPAPRGEAFSIDLCLRMVQPNYDVVVTHADVWLRLFSRLAT